MKAHGNRLNQSNTEGVTYERIIPDYLTTLYTELQRINILVREIENIGICSNTQKMTNNTHNIKK